MADNTVDLIGQFGSPYGPFAAPPTVGTGPDATTFNRIPMGPDGNPIMDAQSFLKRNFRAGVGLDPNGSSTQDIMSPDFARGMQRLGLPQLPESVARGIGGFADIGGDPSMLAGNASALLKGLGGSFKGLIGGEGGAVNLDAIRGGGLRAQSPIAQAMESYRQPAPSPLGGGNRLDRVMGADKATLAATDPVRGGIDPDFLPMRQRVLASPDFPDYMTGIQPGSRYLGAGAEAVTLRAPTPGPSEVQRIGFAQGSLRNPVAPPPALDIPEMLPSTTSQVYGTTRLDTMPYVKMGTAGDPASEAAARGLRNSIASRGLDPWDVYGPNIGWSNGTPYVIDRGAVLPMGDQPAIGAWATPQIRR